MIQATTLFAANPCKTRKTAVPGAQVNRMLDVTLSDWLKLALVPLLSYLFGRGAQSQKVKMDLVAADQKSSEILWKRVESLEGKVDANTEKLEDLHNEKVQLTTEIIGLKQQISLLEITKAQYEMDRVMYLAQIAEMDQRLTVKTEELRGAEEKLRGLDMHKIGELPL